MAKYYSSKTDNNAVAYINGKVFTIDQTRPWATGFVVSWDGIFEAVGDDAEIMAVADARRLATYDLGGRFVMPGIHDAHTHLLMAGEGKVWQTNIGWESTEKSIASDLERNMCNCRYAHIVGDWVVGNFYLPSLFPEGRPDRKYLDDVFPTTPVLIREMSGHKVLVNSEALRRMNLDPYTSQPPPGGVFVRRPEDGAMTGELFETATGAAWTKLPIPPLAIVKESIRRSIKTCHRYGITSIQEASANTLYLHALRELEEENRLDLDVHPHIVCGNEFFSCETKQSLEALLDVAEAFRSRHVDSRFVKFWLDGSPIEPGSTHCSLDDHGVPDKKFLFFDDETLLEAVRRYDARGFTCKMHAAGEGSVRQALDVYQAVRAGNANGPRHEIAHSNAIHPGKFMFLFGFGSHTSTYNLFPSWLIVLQTISQDSPPSASRLKCHLPCSTSRTRLSRSATRCGTSSTGSTSPGQGRPSARITPSPRPQIYCLRWPVSWERSRSTREERRGRVVLGQRKQKRATTTEARRRVRSVGQSCATC